MFDPNSRQAIAGIARGLGVEPAALLAVAEIESAGKPFAMVHGRPMPLIRWECHYFYRLLPPMLRAQGVAARLAHPRAGTIPNPASQEARYNMLERGKQIHEEAALSSCSWGLGQVMGSHWKALGFGSIQQFVTTACSGVAGQTELMARFIKRHGLTTALKQRNWTAFAKAYNGPAYRANRYDAKMANAYMRYLGKAPPPGVATPILVDYAASAEQVLASAPAEPEFLLRSGSSGPAVRELQDILRRAGYFVYIDGNYGAATVKAVAEFQRRSGLNPTGGVDAETRARLGGRQMETVAPWWSKRTGGGSPGQRTQQPGMTRNSGNQPWWEASREALPVQQGKKAWWDV